MLPSTTLVAYLTVTLCLLALACNIPATVAVSWHSPLHWDCLWWFTTGLSILFFFWVPLLANLAATQADAPTSWPRPPILHIAPCMLDARVLPCRWSLKAILGASSIDIRAITLSFVDEMSGAFNHATRGFSSAASVFLLHRKTGCYGWCLRWASWCWRRSQLLTLASSEVCLRVPVCLVPQKKISKHKSLSKTDFKKKWMDRKTIFNFFCFWTDPADPQWKLTSLESDKLCASATSCGSGPCLNDKIRLAFLLL